MQMKATVRSAVPTMVPADVEYQGKTVKADIPVLDVELVTDNPAERNPMIYAPIDHTEMFQPGARVTITIEPFAGD